MWYIIIFIATLILDQVTKIITDGGKVNIVLIENILNIKAIRNKGASFSFLAGVEWAQTFFICLTSIVLVCAIIFICIKTPKGKWLNTTIALMLSGTLGNFIDRIAFREVRDFIDVEFFANFNVADICLCVGAVMLVVYILFLDKDAVFKSKKKEEKVVINVDDDEKSFKAKNIAVKNDKENKDNK